MPQAVTLDEHVVVARLGSGHVLERMSSTS